MKRSQFDRHKVAAVILEAMKEEIPVLRVLQEIFDVDVATARWMQRWARSNGALGFKQHRPVRAVIRRGTPHEKAWLVCQTCIDHWPCHPARLFAMVAPVPRNRQKVFLDEASWQENRRRRSAEQRPGTDSRGTGGAA